MLDFGFRTSVERFYGNYSPLCYNVQRWMVHIGETVQRESRGS